MMCSTRSIEHSPATRLQQEIAAIERQARLRQGAAQRGYLVAWQRLCYHDNMDLGTETRIV